MIISNALIVDVIEGGTRGPCNLVIENGSIVQISTEELQDGNERTILNAGGKYLAPGLINVHEHQSFKLIPGTFGATIQDPPEALLLRSVRSALMSLQKGVTSIRDLGAKGGTNLLMKDAVKNNIILGPRMQASGEPICRTGGHAWQMCIEADGADAVRSAARRLVKRGADWIKVMATGGALPGFTFEKASKLQFTQVELKAAVEEAQRANIKAAAHVVGAESIRECIESGVTTIEHGVGLDEPTIDLILQRGVWLVPTLSVYHRSVMEHSKWQRSGDTWAASKSLYEKHRDCMRLAIQAGVPMAAGTDSIGDMVEEMQLLMGLGMESSEAIRSATINGARLMNMDHLVGSVDEGKSADLILLDANPLDDISSLKTPSKVFLAGEVVYDREGGVQIKIDF